MSNRKPVTRKYVHTNGKVYRSKKFPMLEEIFKSKNPNNEQIPVIPFTLSDISQGYRAAGIKEPASISNTILDLTRKGSGGIESRLPESIYSLGYDLRKKTGTNHAGEFVYVGVGNQLNSWLIWPEEFEEIEVDSRNIPDVVLDLIRKDEGGLFSIVDYSDAFSIAIDSKKGTITRIQNPMKWQPNEIDGFYGRVDNDGVVYSVEAKALSTSDDINLVQLSGGVKTVCHKLDLIEENKYTVVPVALQGIVNGFLIGIFASTTTDHQAVSNYNPILERAIRVRFSPPIRNWQGLKSLP